MVNTATNRAGLDSKNVQLGGVTVVLAPAFPSLITEMARALRGPGPRSALDQHVAAVLATVQISSLDIDLQLSGLCALSQAVEEVTERDHPLVRPDRTLRLACCRGKRLA